MKRQMCEVWFRLEVKVHRAFKSRREKTGRQREHLRPHVVMPRTQPRGRDPTIKTCRLHACFCLMWLWQLLVIEVRQKLRAAKLRCIHAPQRGSGQMSSALADINTSPFLFLRCPSAESAGSGPNTGRVRSKEDGCVDTNIWKSLHGSSSSSYVAEDKEHPRGWF